MRLCLEMRYVVLVLCIIKRFHTLRTAMIRYDFEFVRQKNSFFVEVEWMNKSVDNVAETYSCSYFHLDLQLYEKS